MYAFLNQSRCIIQYLYSTLAGNIKRVRGDEELSPESTGRETEGLSQPRFVAMHANVKRTYTHTRARG